MALRPEGDRLPRVCLAQYGEGEVFGPVIAVAVRLDEQSAAALADLSGVAWPKMSAPEISRTARRISAVVPYAPVQLTPRKYNTLLNKCSGNRTKVLNWAYKTALTEMLSLHADCSVACYDVHAPGFAVLSADLPRGPAVVYRAADEPDPGLAAAGVLARAYFEKILADLERKAGAALPRVPEEADAVLAALFDRGASPMVLQMAKKDDPRVQRVIAPAKSAG